MKANEFVKIFGWGKAKEVSSFTSNVCEDPTHFDSDLDIYVHFDDFKGVMDESDVCIHDIKRLVESHSVVSQYQSLDAAKERLQYFINWLAEHWTHAEFAPEIAKFKQAITDVESCL